MCFWNLFLSRFDRAESPMRGSDLLPVVVRNRCRVRSQRNGNEKRFTEEQIIGVLKEAEAGPRCRTVPQARDLGGHLLQLEGEVRRYDRSDAQRLKELEQENNKLKKLLAESMLDKAALQDLLSRK